MELHVFKDFMYHPGTSQFFHLTGVLVCDTYYLLCQCKDPKHVGHAAPLELTSFSQVYPPCPTPPIMHIKNALEATSLLSEWEAKSV